MNWTDKDMLAFARVASAGAYGDYEGCRMLEEKLARYKKLKDKSSKKTALCRELGNIERCFVEELIHDYINQNKDE